MKLSTRIKKLSKFEIMGIAALFVEVVLIFLLNLICAPKYIDCDSAKLMEHIIKMWEHKSLTIDQWFYSTTVEWDCVTIFALPIYGLTKNIFFACALANVIFALIFIWTVMFMFKGESRLKAMVAATVILIPWRMGMLDYFNMLFQAGSQYIVKILVPLMFVGIILYIEREDMTKWWKQGEFMAMLVVFTLFLFITTASSSVYVCATGLAPVCVIYAVKKLFDWKRLNGIHYVLVGLMAVSVLLGYIINGAVLGGTRGDSMAYCEMGSIFWNFEKGFVGLYEMFGGATRYDGVVVMDYYGIVMLLRIIFVTFLLVSAFISLARCIKGKASLRNLFLTSIFFWNWFVIIITETQAGSDGFEYRYHLMGIIPLMILAISNLYDFIKAKAHAPKILLVSCAFAFLALVLVLRYRESFSYGEQNHNVWSVVEYFEDTDYDHIYIYEESNESDKLRLVGNPKHYITVMEEGVTWAYDFYEYYENGPIIPEGAALIIRRGWYGYSEEDVFFGYNIVKVGEVDDYDVYLFADYME